jgi:outer membrane protein assembly factor BamB
MWATTPAAPTNKATAAGTLRAFDPLTLAELWDSDQNSARDTLGTFSKFSAPTVFNGKVYVATFSNQVVVYGLLP